MRQTKIEKGVPNQLHIEELAKTFIPITKALTKTEAVKKVSTKPQHNNVVPLTTNQASDDEQKNYYIIIQHLAMR